jgi:hypothetical protein
LDKRVVPGALKAYAAAEITSACGCLSLKPKATTTVPVAGNPVIIVSFLTIHQKMFAIEG